MLPRIFERVDVQRFLQPARSATFRVFENLLNRHLRCKHFIGYGFYMKH